MADDRKKRPHRDHGYPRPPSSVPVEIDPELTPLPAAPPTREAFDELPVREQTRELRDRLADHGEALGRVWDARHVSQRLERLETTVAQDTRRVGELIVAVEHWGETSRKAFDKSLANAEEQIRIDGALVRILDKLSELVDEVKGFNATAADFRERLTGAESEIVDVKAKLAEHDEALVALDQRVAKFERADTEKVIRSDERRRWFALATKFPKIVTAIIAAAVAIAGYLGITHL